MGINKLDSLSRFTFSTFEKGGFNLPEQKQRTLSMAFEAGKNFAEAVSKKSGYSGWIVFQGGTGCGKTHLAAAIANEVQAGGLEVVFVSTPALLDCWQDSISLLPHDAQLDTLREIPLLVLDDLDIATAPLWVQQKLFQLIDHRYLARLPTVFTLTRGGAVGERIYSRLIDSDISLVREITAPDFRFSRSNGEFHPRSGACRLHRLTEKTFGSFDLRPYELSSQHHEHLKKLYNNAQAIVRKLDGTMLIFSGKSGSGKTHLAAAMANEVRRQGGSALFVSVPDLLDYLRESTRFGLYEARLAEFREKADLLVLDDLGWENSTDWTKEKLYQILSGRSAARLTTVVVVASAEPDPVWKEFFLKHRGLVYIEMLVNSYPSFPPLGGRKRYPRHSKR